MSNGKPKLRFLGLRSGWPLWAAAAATLAFGLVLLIWPGIATEWILNLCGAALLIAGAANIFRYYRRGDAYRAYNWDLSVGILLALAGLALIAFKAMLLSIVPLLFGIALLIGGAVKIQAACNLRRMRYGRWYLTMIGAVISFLARRAHHRQPVRDVAGAGARHGRGDRRRSGCRTSSRC